MNIEGPHVSHAFLLLLAAPSGEPLAEELWFIGALRADVMAERCDGHDVTRSDCVAALWARLLAAGDHGGVAVGVHRWVVQALGADVPPQQPLSDGVANLDSVVATGAVLRS